MTAAFDPDTLDSQILAGTSIVLGFAHVIATLPIVTDHRIVNILNLKWTSTGGREVVHTTLQHLCWVFKLVQSAEEPLIADTDDGGQQGQTPAEADSPSVLFGWDGHEIVKTILDEKIKLEEKLNDQAERTRAAETSARETGQKCKLEQA